MTGKVHYLYRLLGKGEQAGKQMEKRETLNRDGFWSFTQKHFALCRVTFRL